jgi:hypothetical protein
LLHGEGRWFDWKVVIQHLISHLIPAVCVRFAIREQLSASDPPEPWIDRSQAVAAAPHSKAHAYANERGDADAISANPTAKKLQIRHWQIQHPCLSVANINREGSHTHQESSAVRRTLSKLTVGARDFVAQVGLHFNLLGTNHLSSSIAMKHSSDFVSALADVDACVEQQLRSEFQAVASHPL